MGSKTPITLKANKRSLVLSGNTVMRERDPPNPGMVEKLTNFVFDHSEQMPIKPDGWGRMRHGKKADTTMNRNGKFAGNMRVTVGGSPDARGVPYPKSTPVKQEKY